jgi:signal transduction histidine kinase
MDFWGRLFDPTGFVPRAECGEWTPALIRLHNVSDFFIWTAYLAIPVVLVRFAYARRRELPFRQLFGLFGLFILACGTTHLMDIVLFYNPLYRLSGAVKLITAAASWGTVVALVSVVPAALAMRSPQELEREINEREKAEAEVRLLNSQLEERVRERTFELESAYREKEELLAREQQARREAEAASKYKDEFLATLSHELRTPLNSILGWTSLLRTGKLDVAMTEQALETIERSTRVQTRLVEDILDVSRVMAGSLQLETEPVDIASIVRASEVAVRPAAEAKNIRIEMDVPEEPCVVRGDVPRLQQVVWNLLSNAIKFSPVGSVVGVQVARSREQVLVTVRDSGEGIAPEFLPHVFDRFRQADSSSTRRHGGLGLGLAVVRMLVEMHGGSVEAQSGGVGQGATFTVTLPLFDAAAAPASPASTVSGAAVIPITAGFAA